MPHELVLVEWVHPNPCRNFDRNPIREDQVAKIMESIGRTGFWDNIVARPHPDKPGEFQIAYGHNRLEALRRSDISECVLPVRNLSDWDMYCMMVDENESQQEISPAIVFENIETGLEIVEEALESIGPKGTEKAFYSAVGRTYVPPGTEVRGKHNGGFEMVRNAFFRDGVIGRVFVEDFLPCGKIRHDTVNTVLNSHYGEKLEKAKRKEEEAKRKEASAKHKQAQAEWDLAEAERLREQSRKAADDANKLAKEAARIAAGTINEKILLAFDNPKQMTAFASAIKNAGVPKSHHQAAMKYVKEEDIGSGKMAEKLRKWWFEESGQAQAQYDAMVRAKQDKERRRIQQRGNFEPFLTKMQDKMEDLAGDIGLALDAARYYDDEEHRESARETCEQLRAKLDELIEQLTGPPVADVPGFRKMIELPSMN